MGTIPVTDSSGNSSSKHVAVVVGLGGVGPAASATSCPANPPAANTPPQVPMLVVVDVSQAYTQGSPLTPRAIGFLQLVDQNGNPVSGTDVTLNGSVALVATGTNVLLVNLENPSQPTLAGQITGSFGNWVALTDNGILIGSSPNSTSGSVQTAALGSYILIQSMTTASPKVDDNGNTTEPVQVTVNAKWMAITFHLLC